MLSGRYAYRGHQYLVNPRMSVEHLATYVQLFSGGTVNSLEREEEFGDSIYEYLHLEVHTSCSELVLLVRSTCRNPIFSSCTRCIDKELAWIPNGWLEL